MITMNIGKKAYRLGIGAAVGNSTGSRTVHLVHANDQASDDFEGRGNWSFMLVLFAALISLAACAVIWFVL